MFDQHMIQHASSYQLLHALQNLSDGDLEILAPLDFKNCVTSDIRNMAQSHLRHETTYITRVIEM